ncbi:hypothetical protein pb186bvf_016296 [Paramecium bursaria]
MQLNRLKCLHPLRMHAAQFNNYYVPISSKSQYQIMKQLFDDSFMERKPPCVNPKFYLYSTNLLIIFKKEKIVYFQKSSKKFKNQKSSKGFPFSILNSQNF